MQSLFFKIFLWFWLSIVVVIGTLVVSAGVIRSRSQDNDRWNQLYHYLVQVRGKRTAELADREGKEAALNYVDSLERLDAGNYFADSKSVRDYLVDQNGNELLGQQISPEILSVLPQMSQYPVGEPHFFRAERFAADKIAGPSGQIYTFILPIPEIPLHRQVSAFLSKDIGKVGFIYLGSVLIVAGIFCYWLARNITNPIDSLRVAATGIANEHLEARVNGSVLKRRDELAQLGRDFNRMAERIDALVTSERRFLADVSHQLRSPLTRLNLALGLARHEGNGATTEQMDRIEEETERLNKLIGQLLTLARVESGVDLEQKKIFDLNVLVQGVASDGDFEARSLGCGVRFTYTTECLVDGAFEMLRGAVENVVRNAIRYTARGTNVEVAIRYEPEIDSRAIIEVRDHGCGIPEGELDQLFIPFHRGSNGDSKSSHGAGLGLAIADRSFRTHGGKVTAANAPGGGLLVALELPVLRHFDARSEARVFIGS
ncbi:MAG TPA: ATP-binding protein [Bryobacteraceae bacterium]|nr:ATP-binding protein [Bryobacteraceae bacterium]